jgi:hypothetical protein
MELWRCPTCGEAWTARGRDAHCAGSQTERTYHPAVACERITVIRRVAD